jgi:hypothetical protein
MRICASDYWVDHWVFVFYILNSDSGVCLQITSEYGILLLIKSRTSKVVTLLERERYVPKRKAGGGVLSYEVWGYLEGERTFVTRYNLAYINKLIYQGDNGRVIGYDNAHDYHHRHYFGFVESVSFVSYEDTVRRFESDWRELVASRK